MPDVDSNVVPSVEFTKLHQFERARIGHSTHFEMEATQQQPMLSESVTIGSTKITIRPLSETDHAALFPLLSQLTSAPQIPYDKYVELLHRQQQSDDHYVFVALRDQVLIGTASLFLMHKFIRGAGICAFVEDVVVDKSVRGLHIGRTLITKLVQLAKEKGCYKVVLDCAKENVAFYEKCGFEQHGTQMTIYF